MAAALAVTSMGAQQKDNNFMTKVTKSHTTVLDPTSQIQNLHPSKHTTIKDWKFGLGLGKDPDIIDMMAAKYPSVAKDFGDPEAEVKAQIAAESRRGRQEGGGVGSNLAAPQSAEVAAMAAEAKERGEVVDEMLAHESVGLWETGGGGGGEKKKELGGRPLSVLEQRYMVEARERQKANLFVKQVVGGKEWVGPAFLAAPKVLLFKDFNVGQTYDLKFTLTNVSYTFNMFRQVPLPEQVRSFFELTHVPPGRMSAGTSSGLSLRFEPKLEEDIEFELPLLTQTGPMTVPVRALCKKVVLSASASELDFSGVVLGERYTLPLIIKNDGALPSTYTIKLMHASHPAEVQAASELLLMSQDLLPQEDEIFTFPLTGEIAPYASTEIPLTYRPRNPGNSLGLLQLVFGNDGTDAPAVEVSIYGEGVKVPIYVERETIDFRTCVFGDLFRDDLVLVNRGKTALQVQLKVPPELHGNLEFIPTMGFVQARANFKVGMKLHSAEDLLLRCKRFVNDDMLEIPIRVLVPDQALPVYFLLKAQLTTSELVFTVDGVVTSALDFGTCPINAARAIPLEIYNPSALATRFGFLPLPKELDVQPGDGLGTILPGETISREVLFAPIAGTKVRLDLVCRTTLNRRFVLKATGRGIEPTLQLSSTSVMLPATAEGDTSQADVVVKNASSVPRSFQLDVPEGSEATGHLKVSPLVGTLQPGEAVRVLVEYTAPLKPPDPEPEEEGEGEGEGEGGEGGEAEVAAPAEAEAGGEAEAEDEGAGEGEGEGGDIEEGAEGEEGVEAEEVPEPWSVHQQLTLTCFVKAEGKAYMPEDTLYLGVETAAVRALLLLGNGRVRQKLQFGAVPVGQLQMQSVMVRNQTDLEVQLDALPLDPTGPFSLLNALPKLPPHGAEELQVRFLPTNEFTFEEHLVISAAGTTLRATLQGRGVAPTLEVRGEQSEDGKTEKDVPVVEIGGAETTLLHLGDCLVGDEASGAVDILNTSQFALRLLLTPLASGHANLGPLPPLDVSPTEATVEAGKRLRVNARFAPDHAGEDFFELLKVEVPNQEGGQTLMLRGRAWACAGYVLTPEQQATGAGATGTALLHAPPQDMVALPPPELGSAAAAEPRVIELALSPSAGAPGTATLIVGNLKPSSVDAKDKPAPFEFSFEGLSDEASKRGFSIEPMKGSVEAGGTKEVVVSFAPNPDAVRGSELGVIASFGVSQWAEATLKCVLKGGSPAPPPEQSEIVFKLRGHVPSSILDAPPSRPMSVEPGGKPKKK